jgi:hypothetical protein
MPPPVLFNTAPTACRRFHPGMVIKGDYYAGPAQIAREKNEIAGKLAVDYN